MAAAALVITGLESGRGRSASSSRGDAPSVSAADVGRPEDEPEVALYRAVGLNEAADIEGFGGFRGKPAAYEEGKWFATTYDNAVVWGTAMQAFSGTVPRPFRVAEAVVPTSFVATWTTGRGTMPSARPTSCVGISWRR